MALLATSCTMRNKPSRLLDKGPEYLRTRTNSQLFAHRRKSAVELLAASKPQYVKSPAVLDTSHDLAVTPDRLFRSRRSKEKLPPRSKSEFDISRLQELESDEADGNPGEQSDGDAEEPTGDFGDRTSLTSSPITTQTAGDATQPDGETTSSGATTITATTSTTTTTCAITPADTASKRQDKIDNSPDREDDSEFFSTPHASSAPATAAALTTPATPASTVPPPLPPKPKPKPKPKPRVKPKPSVAQPAPVIYTAKPIYINLATTQAQPGNGATTTSTTTTPTTPTTAAGAAAHGNTITTITASQAAGLSAMSEESSDRTPTNPTGGDVAQVTHLTATTPVEEGAACAGTRSKAVDISSTADGTVGAVIANVVSVSAGATSSSAPKGGLHVSDLSSGGGAMAGYPVPRSFSDISCHHSRAGSDVSSEASRASRTSRASRASAGANLEKFFNEMGMEKDILDPLLRRQQRQGSELDIYESVSSLDSHDARSICSALSRTEMRDLSSSDAESFSDRGQQQTSVVERNARIIKWLCSVKKAKHTQPGFQGSAS